MQRWSLWANTYCKTGIVCVEELPWYVAVVDWLFNHWLSHSSVPCIPLPNWVPRARDKYAPDDISTLKDYYGDLSQLYCARIDMPLFYWVQKHPKRKEYTINVSYDELKAIFYASAPEWFDRLDKQAIEFAREDYEELQQEGEKSDKRS